MEPIGEKLNTLKHLIHFYRDENYLFQTVTMYGEDEQDEALDSLVESKTWYWGRFAESERAGYMARRIAVEKMLYDEFEGAYWRLANRYPVYFYLIHSFLPDAIEREMSQRQQYQECDTKYLVFDLDLIKDRKNITFTVNDSLRSYRKKLLLAGIPCRRLSGGHPDLPDYGKVFHMDDLEEVYGRNTEVPDLRFEVQVWDKNILQEIVNDNDMKTNDTDRH